MQERSHRNAAQGSAHPPGTGQHVSAPPPKKKRGPDLDLRAYTKRVQEQAKARTIEELLGGRKESQQAIDSLLDCSQAEEQTSTPAGASLMRALEQRERELIEAQVYVAERERTIHRDEMELTERERELHERENNVAERERELVESEALLRARVKLFEERFEKAQHEAGPSNAQLKELRELQASFEERERALREAEELIREREQFLESSENDLFEKGLALQEKEVALEQLEDDLTMRENMLGEAENVVRAAS